MRNYLIVSKDICARWEHAKINLIKDMLANPWADQKDHFSGRQAIRQIQL